MYMYMYTGKTSWTPVTGKGLPLRRKEDNQHDEHLVAIINNGDVVHVPCSSLFYFLKRGEDVYVTRHNAGKKLL